jgi:hypothetical protein
VKILGLELKILLYEEKNLNELTVDVVLRYDLRERPDTIIVVGTCIELPGARMSAKGFYRVAIDYGSMRNDHHCHWKLITFFDHVGSWRL